MSAPRRMPPSISTSICPFTVATISGRAAIAAGTQSSCRPPWFETEIAAAPASTARRASSAVRMPFTTIGPDQLSRIQRISSQATTDLRRAVPTSVIGIPPCPGRMTFSSLGTPPSSRNETSHLGVASTCGKKGIFAKTLPVRSSAVPLRKSRSRMPATGVSTVMTSAEKPALRARSIAASAASLPPTK